VEEKGVSIRNISVRSLRIGVVFGIVIGSLGIFATPSIAGSPHATLSADLRPPVLTLSDATTRHGLLKVDFRTLNTTAANAVLTVKFTLQSGTTTQPQQIAISEVNGSPSPLGCDPLNVLTDAYKCDLGNVSPNSTVLRFIEFVSPQADACTVSQCLLISTTTVSFAEAGNDLQGGPQGTKNDSLSETDTIALVLSAAAATASGGCQNVTSGSLGLIGTLASATANQASQVTFNQASPVGGVEFPCTWGATGLKKLSQIPVGLHSDQVWFVDLQLAAPTQLATALLTVFDTPSGLNSNNFVLYERVTDTNTFFVVPQCQNGLIPPGAPGPNFPTVTAFDSCVFATQAYGHGGVQVTVKLYQFGDPDFDY
jgi:hypothetical protein